MKLVLKETVLLKVFLLVLVWYERLKVVLRFGYLRAECPLMRICVNLNFIITNVLAAWRYSP